MINHSFAELRFNSADHRVAPPAVQADAGLQCSVFLFAFWTVRTNLWFPPSCAMTSGNMLGAINWQRRRIMVSTFSGANPSTSVDGCRFPPSRLLRLAALAIISSVGVHRHCQQQQDLFVLYAFIRHLTLTGPLPATLRSISSLWITLGKNTRLLLHDDKSATILTFSSRCGFSHCSSAPGHKV